MKFNIGANWEIVVDGKPRSYRDDLEIAREAARYLRARNSKAEVAVRNFTTGEELSIMEHDSTAWADRKKVRR
jgi:hypothetical protein